MYTKKRWKNAAEDRTAHAVCSLCAQEIFSGECVWYHNGRTVCEDCFPSFAREELKPFEYISGEETAE